MDNTIRTSDHVYEILKELKEDLDHSSFDSVLRDVLNRAGLTEEGQNFTTITDYELGYYTDWVEDKEAVKKIEFENDDPMYQHRATGHKTYGPVPHELEMFGYHQGFEDGKTNGIVYAWPMKALDNHMMPPDESAGTCAQCGKDVTGKRTYFTAEFRRGMWHHEHDSVCGDCELPFPTSEENPQIVMTTRPRRNLREDKYNPFDYVQTDIEIVKRYYPDEREKFWE